MYTNPRSQHFRFGGANAYATREHVARWHPGVEADRARVQQRYVRPRWCKRCMCARQTSRSSDFDSRSRDFCNAPADSFLPRKRERKKSRLFFAFPNRRQSRPRYACSLDGPAFPGAVALLPFSPFPGRSSAYTRGTCLRSTDSCRRWRHSARREVGARKRARADTHT